MGRRNRNLTFIDLIYWVTCIYSMLHGYAHLLEPNILANWYGLDYKYDQDARDFSRLVGVGLLMHSMMAAVVPISIKEMNTKLIFMSVFLMYSLGSVGFRFSLYMSGRFHVVDWTSAGSGMVTLQKFVPVDLSHQPTTMFMLTMLLDMIFVLTYARCIQYYRGIETTADPTLTAVSAASPAITNTKSAATIAMATQKNK